MSANWFYAPDSQQLGPVSAGQLVQLAAAGTIQPDTLIWKEGLANWVKARQVLGLVDAPAEAGEMVDDPEITRARQPQAPASVQPSANPTWPGQTPAAPIPYSGPQTGYGPGSAPPPNYLVWAILSTIFCCWPLGIPAIVFAAQVNSKFQAGNYAEALQASQKAKLWCWISFGVGLPVTILIVLAQVAMR